MKGDDNINAGDLENEKDKESTSSDGHHHSGGGHIHHGHYIDGYAAGHAVNAVAQSDAVAQIDGYAYAVAQSDAVQGAAAVNPVQIG